MSHKEVTDSCEFRSSLIEVLAKAAFVEGFDARGDKYCFLSTDRLFDDSYSIDAAQHLGKLAADALARTDRLAEEYKQLKGRLVYLVTYYDKRWIVDDVYECIDSAEKVRFRFMGAGFNCSIEEKYIQ